MTNKQELFNSRLIYNHDTGVLSWKHRAALSPTDKTWNKKWAGKNLQSPHKRGNIFYVRFRVDDKPYYAHRVIWQMVYGEEPDVIDHINGNGMDNRLFNLRNVTNKINTRNARKRTDNTSGITGVWWSKEKKKWVAEVGTKKYGYFANKEDAHQKCLSIRNANSFHINHGNIR